MNKRFYCCVLAMTCTLCSLPALAEDCHPVHGSLTEDRVEVGCDPGEAFCFIGTFLANQGLRGTTHFKADGAAAGPVTATPGFISYSGPFEYRFPDGTLQVRETGLTNPRRDVPASGVTVAYQQVVGGTGAYLRATGYLFVQGVNVENHVVTVVDGELCSIRE